MVAAAALAAPLAAQERCEQGRVGTITVQTRRVFADSAGAMLSKVYDAANWLHVETRDGFIRRELLFREGDCFDRFRLDESERLLREFPFFQSVSVEALPRSDGDVDVRVVTQDDWSLRLEPRVEFGSGPEVTGVGLAERNLMGTGRLLGLSYIDRPGRDEVGGAYFDPQLLGTRWNLDLRAARTAPGWLVRGRVAYPFLGLVGRWALFQDVRYGEEWFRYVVGDNEERVHLVQPFTQRAFQLGGAGRLIADARDDGTKLGAYGVTLSYERLTYAGSFIHDSTRARALGITETATSAELQRTLSERENLRLNFVVGVRGLEFVERRGLATLRATEDIPIGASADLALGLATKAFGSSDDHLLAAVGLFGGARVAGRWYSLLRANVEARRDYEERRWHDIFGVIDWTNFWELSERHTVVLTSQYSAGWDATIPFQLTLGGPTGLAGLPAHRYPGGARAVARLENRWFIAQAGRLFDLGALVFADVGEIWANDALFGVDSGLRGSLGAGLRLATPSGSRLAYRLEVAAPVRSGVDLADLVLSIRIERFFRLSSGLVDPQLARSRDVGVQAFGQNLR